MYITKSTDLQPSLQFYVLLSSVCTLQTSDGPTVRSSQDIVEKNLWLAVWSSLSSHSSCLVGIPLWACSKGMCTSLHVMLVNHGKHLATFFDPIFILNQVTGALVRMTASAPSAVVRAKSALALSLVLDEIQEFTIWAVSIRLASPSVLWIIWRLSPLQSQYVSWVRVELQLWSSSQLQCCYWIRREAAHFDFQYQILKEWFESRHPFLL